MQEAARGAATRWARLPFAGFVHRPVRRPHAGHAGHDGQPAVPQRRGDRLPPPDPLAADAARRARRRDLRQGAAGDDDGAGRRARSARRAGARRRDAAADGRRGRGQGADDRRALRARRDHARGGGRAGLPRLRARRAAAASSSARRPRRRWSARRSGCRCRTRALAPSGQPIWLDMARRSARALLRLDARGLDDARHPDRRRRCTTRWSCTRRSAARPTCCCTSRRSRTRRACRGPTVDDWTRVNRRVPRLVDALPNGPRRPPDGARLPGRRRARGDAAPARRSGCSTRRPDRAPASRSATCSTGGSVSDRRTRVRERLLERGRHRSRRRHHARPTRASATGLTSTVCFPRGNLAPRGLGRSRARRSIRSVVDADGVYRKTRPGARLHDASAPRSPRSRAAGRIGQAGRRARADLPRADGRGHGGDLPAHLGAQVPAVRQARRRWSPTRASPASRPAPASATSARRRWPAARSASCATAT